MAKYDIFISYSSIDKDIAFKILDEIESAGRKCWIAPRNIPYGTPYARAIMDGIEECSTFMVLITENSIRSEDVLNEVDNAHAQKKRIIPVRLSDVALPKEFNYYLSRTHWAILKPNNLSKITELLNLQEKKTPHLPPSVDQKTHGSQQTQSLQQPPTPNINTVNSVITQRPPVVNTNPRKPVGVNHPQRPPITNINPHKPIRIQSSPGLEKKKHNYQIASHILLGVSTLWFVSSCFISNENDGVMFIMLFLTLLVVALMIAALITPSIMGNMTRKHISIYWGISALLMFLTAVVWATPEETPTDPTTSIYEEVEEISADDEYTTIN